MNATYQITSTEIITSTPYNAEWVRAARSCKAKWDAATKTWHFDLAHKTYIESNFYGFFPQAQPKVAAEPTVAQKARAYDSWANEGGEGFNPYDTDREYTATRRNTRGAVAINNSEW